MRRIISCFAGMITGGIVGAAVAILLTPVSGENARFQIQERANSFRDEIKAVADARRAELERELSVLRTPYKKE